MFKPRRDQLLLANLIHTVFHFPPAYVNPYDMLDIYYIILYSLIIYFIYIYIIIYIPLFFQVNFAT